MYKNTPLKDISDIALTNMAEMIINKLNPTTPEHVIFYMKLRNKHGGLEGEIRKFNDKTDRGIV